MNDYRLLGSVVTADLEFPELQAVSGQPPRWMIRAHSAGSPPGGESLIREATALPCTVRLYRTTEGYRLEHLCTGSYSVSGDGSRIEYQPLPGSHLDAVRFDLLGRVMALALHAGGALCLHGSAVHAGRGVLGFIAPKGYGKSTLASALVRGGCQLVSDDLLVIEPSDPCVALPGVHRVRLRDDSFGSVLLDHCKAERGPDGKQVISDFAEDRLMVTPAPVLALYCIEPAPPSDRAIERERLATAAAARTLVSMGKNTVILGQLEILDVLERALLVAGQVPVYRLLVSRDLTRLNEVAGQLLDWHGADSRSRPEAG